MKYVPGFQEWLNEAIEIRKDGDKFAVSSPKSINLKSNDGVEELASRAQSSPTEEEINLSKQMGFKENVIGKEITLNGSKFILTAIRPKNKKPIVFQEKGKWWSYLYLHPSGVKAHLPELAKLM